MEANTVFQVALQLIPGIGNANAKYLISYMGSVENVFSANKAQLLKVPGIGKTVVENLLTKTTLNKSEEICRKCEGLGISIIHYSAKEYPNHLKNVLDAPNLLYFKGKGSLNPSFSLSIVGTRRATDYGNKITYEIVEGTSSIKPTIFSGLAYGIDIAAHRASVKLGIPTIGVIAGGIDKLYPTAHQKTAEQMIENDGGILSEHPPGKIPEAHLFPARNRIIAGISEATVVVEAAIKGGALITADLADSYNKPVFAVPGNTDSEYSAGCNNLIRDQKALIYTQPKDIFYHLNWDLDNTSKISRKITIDLSKEEKHIIEVLSKSNGLLEVDDLAWKSQIQVNKLASLLLNMEFKGLIKSLPGKKYQML